MRRRLPPVCCITRARRASREARNLVRLTSLLRDFVGREIQSNHSLVAATNPRASPNSNPHPSSLFPGSSALAAFISLAARTASLATAKSTLRMLDARHPAFAMRAAKGASEGRAPAASSSRRLFGSPGKKLSSTVEEASC